MIHSILSHPYPTSWLGDGVINIEPAVSSGLAMIDSIISSSFADIFFLVSGHQPSSRPEEPTPSKVAPATRTVPGIKSAGLIGPVLGSDAHLAKFHPDPAQIPLPEASHFIGPVRSNATNKCMVDRTQKPWPGRSTREAPTSRTKISRLLTQAF